MSGTIKLAAFGDVVGDAGRLVLEKHLQGWRSAQGIDFCIVNGENIADGSGLTPHLFKKLRDAGADAVTTGDHVGRKSAIFPTLANDVRIVRPANYPEEFPGRGVTFLQVKGMEIGVANLIGRVFIQGESSCPFRAADEIVKLATQRKASLLVFDFHAEATSEKIAMGWHLAGRASFVFGTHTHIPTADARVLDGGTAYVTDLGMTGPYDSVIGRKKEPVLRKFTTGIPSPFEVAKGDARACGAVVVVDAETGRARSIERVELRMGDPVAVVPVEAGAAVEA